MTDHKIGGKVYHVQKSYSSKSGAAHAASQLRAYGLLAVVKEKKDSRGVKFYDLCVHYGRKKR